MPEGLSFLFAVAAGLALPILLLPIVKLIGYSEIIEEIAKATLVLVLFSRMTSTRNALIEATAVFGLSFGLSENLFYLNNFFQIGIFTVFWQRFVLTVPMHALTSSIFALAYLAGRKWIIIGLAGAIVLHLLFNIFVANLVT